MPMMFFVGEARGAAGPQEMPRRRREPPCRGASPTR
ncbi:hypothetical protein CGRA01v4_00822 [Colletotrichum graminicola]|nr:hypothetical protein CGRA01v4_00822 [Colletotrichum graminicola]